MLSQFVVGSQLCVKRCLYLRAQAPFMLLSMMPMLDTGAGQQGLSEP